jgi:hypothetical protein
VTDPDSQNLSPVWDLLSEIQALKQRVSDLEQYLRGQPKVFTTGDSLPQFLRTELDPQA